MPDLPIDGPGAPPRDNGELVFDAPWQTRAFGAAVALHEAGHLPWNRFQSALIGRVAEAERADAPYEYWACWLRALEDVVAELGITAADLGRREEALADRPDGHDHRH